MKAISVSVYSSPKYGPCAAGGVSEKYDELLLLHERGPREVTGDEPNLCRVVRRDLWGRDVYHIEPANGHGGYMFGGSYAASCDSRFSELVGGQYGAIAIHDRKEW